jgi:hypothetical protein
MVSRQIQASVLWDWLKWQLPPDVRALAEQFLRSSTPPPLTDPALISGLAEIRDPRTTEARRLQLLRQLLQIVKNG